ncbi:hypothetical protein KEM56_002662, partial [Ascosphaera pollenicola]
HPTLGSIKGLEVLDGVHQFRGLPYAKVTQRWENSTVLSTLNEATSKDTGGTIYDATKWGPMSPQPAGSISIDFGLIQQELPYAAEEATMNEFKCLNLNVTKPSTASQEKLPVLFVIHGGAFFIGANSWPQYDTSRLVQLSARIGRPFIAVSINYRLGHLGFLSSSELGPTDSPGNYGLVDQQNAMRWVKANIAGFGGDPENITCFGDMPVRDVTVRPIQPIDKQQRRYEELLGRLGIEGATPEDRVAQLKKVPWEDLVKDPANFRPFPTISGGYKDSSLYMKAFIDKPWEGKWNEALEHYLTPEEAQLVLDTWQIGQRKTDQTPVDLGLLQFINDVRFYWPVVRTIGSAPANANLRVYHFHQSKPFDGIAKGLASHELDLALLLLNYSSEVDSAVAATSELLATHIIEFAFGALPQDRSSATVFDNGVQRRVNHDVYDRVERHKAAQVLKTIGPEKCFNMLELLQFGEIN